MPETATRKLTRAERSEVNRRAHARKRQELESSWRQAAQAKRERREARRAENRATWWRMKYGVITPGTERMADDMAGIKCRSFERPTLDEWRIIGADGRGYRIERRYSVSIPGMAEALDMPSARDAEELVNLAIDTCTESGQFQVGASFAGFEILKVRKDHVIARNPRGREQRHKINFDADGLAWIKTAPRATEWYRKLYAKDFS